jgi:glycosyltransferase involved in cell wall biosynthesis
VSVKRVAKHLLRPVSGRILDAVASRVRNRLGFHGMTSEESSNNCAGCAARADLDILAAARSIAAGGDQRVTLPTEPTGGSTERPIQLGFCGNMANNAYNFVKALRRLGHSAELVVEDGYLDAFIMNRPFWEDVEVECDDYEQAATFEKEWRQPHFVRRVEYDQELQARFQHRQSAIPEVQKLYRETFGLELPTDRALVLAQSMGHWPSLVALSRYDVIQLSGSAISLGPFCPKPYVVFPTGSDLFVSPFQETLFGLLMRAGYRGAAHVLICETNYPAYLDRLAMTCPRSFAPMMIDTVTYAPGDSQQVRQQWRERSGGERFLYSVCRQAWQWKGNDRLLRAFAEFTSNGNSDWRLVLQQWGPDVERSQQLIGELGLENRVLYETLCSKPVLRRRQQAADVVADQFVMEGYGTSVLESMAASKPVLMRPVDDIAAQNFRWRPPFLGATTVEEITHVLQTTLHDDALRSAGEESLRWLQEHHGYESVSQIYLDAMVGATRGTEKIAA